ncbi:laminin subunit alpha-4 [Ochlerotatus camptorhynchus]|uniref:laminin subunit alpha-4 n=1 Tax=Ochlerotatus camptorhynchus TaxID=644619 RepID=UPI0031E3B239
MISIRDGWCSSGVRRSRHGTSFFTTPQRLAIASLIVLLADRSCASPEDHVCFRYESYTELEMVPRNQTVQVLTREWCLEIPPRCTSYRPEIKEVYVKQNVTRMRKIEYCCEGYEQILAEEATTPTVATTLSCRPVCRGGCGRGLCELPNSCTCEAGFTGKHCTQRCRTGTWGENCKHRCHCQNYSLCDSKSGHCRCTDGWIGNHCETSCPSGFYGTLCKSQCNCSTSRCDPESGKCLAEDGLVMFENITRTVEKDYSGESTERILMSQWVKVDSTSSTTPQVTTDNGDIDSINSTYAQSYQEYLPLNTNITLIPMENSTTTTEESKHDTVYEIVASTTKVEITFIVSSESSTTEHSKSSKGPELVFVESDDRTDLVEVVDDKKDSNNEDPDEQVNHTQAVVTISSLLLALVLLLSVVAYMKKINRKTMMKQQQMIHQHQQHQRQTSVNGERGPDSPRILEPLPDIPKVIYTRVKAKNHREGNGELEHYDVPINNTSVNKSSPYNYNFTLSKPPPGHHHLPARKYSLEHIYDEIQYPPMTDLNSSTTSATGENTDEDHFSKSILADTKMAPVKVIDEIKGKQ